MKFWKPLLLTAAAASLVSAGGVKLVDKQDSLSYTIAYEMVNSIKPIVGEIDQKLFVKAIKEVLKSDAEKIDAQTRDTIKRELSTLFDKVAKEEREKLAADNLKEGEEYLAKNAQKEDVQVTESGLQYKVIKEGEGMKPSAINKVTVHYTGKLLNGDIFDSSVDRGEPATFPLSRVIKGWTEGLQLMSVGSKYEFTIPAQLAYGKSGGGAKIGPNATLVFEVELLDIVVE